MQTEICIVCDWEGTHEEKEQIQSVIIPTLSVSICPKCGCDEFTIETHRIYKKCETCKNPFQTTWESKEHCNSCMYEKNKISARERNWRNNKTLAEGAQQ